jgi:hypothetical protein
LSCLVLSCLVLSCLVLSCLVLSCLVLSGLVFSFLSCLSLSDELEPIYERVISGFNSCIWYRSFDIVQIAANAQIDGTGKASRLGDCQEEEVLGHVCVGLGLGLGPVNYSL